jgi:hypothetical protein
MYDQEFVGCQMFFLAYGQYRLLGNWLCQQGKERTQGTIAVLVLWLCHALLGFARQLYWLGGLHIAGTSYIGVYVAGCWDNMKDRHGWLLWDCCACGDDAARLRLRLGGGGG